MECTFAHMGDHKECLYGVVEPKNCNYYTIKDLSGEEVQAIREAKYEEVQAILSRYI